MNSVPHLLVLTSAAASLALAGTAAAQPVFERSHGDIGIAYEDGAFESHWHLHTGAFVNGSPLAADAEYGPSELMAFVAAPPIARPAGAAWDFLGASAGSSIWYLPQSEDVNKPFLGIASEELSSDDWSSLTLSLVSVSRPAGGEFSLWQSDAFGNPTVRFSTADGISGADSFAMTIGGHDHYNFGFSERGIYDVTLRWDGVHNTDGAISATETFSFGVTVVPEPTIPSLMATAGVLAWASRHLRRRFHLLRA